MRPVGCTILEPDGALYGTTFGRGNLGTLFRDLVSDIVVRCCPSSILTETFRSESTWQVGKNSSRVSARARLDDCGCSAGFRRWWNSRRVLANYVAPSSGAAS